MVEETNPFVRIQRYPGYPERRNLKTEVRCTEEPVSHDIRSSSISRDHKNPPCKKRYIRREYRKPAGVKCKIQMVFFQIADDQVEIS